MHTLCCVTYCTILLTMKGAIAYAQAQFGPGSGGIYLDEVACTGLETSLLSCTSRPIGDHNCNHHEDAGVSCRGIYRISRNFCCSNIHLVLSMGAPSTSDQTARLNSILYPNNKFTAEVKQEILTCEICYLYIWLLSLATCYRYFHFIQSLWTARMVRWDWLEAMPALKEGLRFASTMTGALCVMILGTVRMRLWSALSSGFCRRVRIYWMYKSRHCDIYLCAFFLVVIQRITAIRPRHVWSGKWPHPFGWSFLPRNRELAPELSK